MKYTIIKLAVINQVLSMETLDLLRNTSPVMLNDLDGTAQYSLGYLLEQMDDTYDEYEEFKKLIKDEVYYIEV